MAERVAEQDKAAKEWVEEEVWAQAETVYAQNADTACLIEKVCLVIK